MLMSVKVNAGVQFCLIMHEAFVSILNSKNVVEFIMCDVY